MGDPRRLQLPLLVLSIFHEAPPGAFFIGDASGTLKNWVVPSRIATVVGHNISGANESDVDTGNLIYSSGPASSD